jgi:hypothetical protein
MNEVPGGFLCSGGRGAGCQESEKSTDDAGDFGDRRT